MRIDATEGNTLMFLFNVLQKGVVCEAPIVGVVVLDLDVMFAEQ